MAIQSHFLDDIQKLRHLAHTFVNQQYDDGIDFFHQRLKTPPDDLQNCLLPLYRDTRFQIHRLVKMLENHQHASADQQAYVASRLHDCLNDIDQCPAGVHSRFAMSFSKIEADQAGLNHLLQFTSTDVNLESPKFSPVARHWAWGADERQ